MQLKIRGKLVVSFSVVIGMVLTALGIITYLTFAESIQSNKEEIAQLHLNNIEYKLNTYIEQQIHELRELSHALPPLDRGSSLPGHQIELLDAYLGSNSDIRNIAISSDKGSVLFSSSALEALKLYEGDGKDNGESDLEIVTDDQGVWLVVPHSSMDGKKNRLAIQFNIGKLMERLLAGSSLNQATILIFRNDEMIYTSDPDRYNRSTLPHAPDTSSTESSDHLTKINGNYVLTANEKRLNWQIDFLLPESIIREDLVNLKNRLIAAVIVVLWTAIWIVLIVAHRISQPIRTLSKATQDIQDFNYSTPIQFPITHDEISDLAASFESMRVYIKGQVSRDPLTGLSNRRYMMHAMGLEMAKAVRTNQSIAVVMVDLDHFKAVNDTYGHQAGDHILMETAKVLQDGVRKYDIAARYGGEEFALVLPFTNAEGALIVAERIRSTLEQKVIEWDNQQIQVTMSVGIASLTFGEDTIDEARVEQEIEQITYQLFEKADAALYVSKESGRNQCRIYNGETDQAEET